METVSLESYAGIAAAVWLLTTMLCGQIPYLKDRQDEVAISLAVLIGVSMKMTTDYYDANGWTTHMLYLVLTVLVAQVAHDKLAKPVARTIKK